MNNSNSNKHHHPTTTKIGAILDFSVQCASDLTEGSAILAKLPENATHGDLRKMIEADHQRLYASAGLPVSQSKGDNEIC